MILHTHFIDQLMQELHAVVMRPEIICCQMIANHSQLHRMFIGADTKLYADQWTHGFRFRRAVYCLICGNYLGQEFTSTKETQHV